VPCYEHYLHHKFFECNYADGAIPIDKWFGTFHDGSKEAEIRMNKRYMDRAKTQRERRDAKAARRVS
jgi:sterol desaturase/sphingolipid hydroxylase (fatty acid hydroxylase superfamily)